MKFAFQVILQRWDPDKIGYLSARIFILVETFISLRSMPATMYETSN
jgi:hypothetical protein